jgi:hypothetical protein
LTGELTPETSAKDDLASPTYLAQGTKSSGILQHGALWVAKGETNESLSFGDYYFLDALNRYEGLL